MDKRKRTPAAQVIRDGDLVLVTDPRFVKRVGYPMSVADYRERLVHRQGPLLDQLFEALFGKHGSPVTRDKVEHELAYGMAKRNRFGGNERTLHWEEHPELVGQRMRVLSVRTAYTGRYYAPSSSRDYWTGETDYEPGGIADAKAHRLARVVPADGKWHDPKKALEIPVYHLRKEGLDGRSGS